MGSLKLVMEVDRKSFWKPLTKSGLTSASFANCCNWGAGDLKIHKNTFVVYDRIENRWFVDETTGLYFKRWGPLRHSCRKCPTHPHLKQALQSLVSWFFTMATLAFFYGVGAIIVELQSILVIVRLDSIGVVTSAIGALFLVLGTIAALNVIRVVFGIRLLRLAAGWTFTTADSLRRTALFF